MFNLLYNQICFLYLNIESNKAKMKNKIMTKQDLIYQIIPMIQNSHNEKDISDLQTFDIDELKEILTDLKEN